MQRLAQAQQEVLEGESESKEEVMLTASLDTDWNAPDVDLGEQSNFPNSGYFICYLTRTCFICQYLQYQLNFCLLH